MSTISLELFTEFRNIFLNIDAEIKTLLQATYLDGSVVLNKEVWMIRELLEWCDQISIDNNKMINQINKQLLGEVEDETIFVNQEIKNLKKENFNLKYFMICCEHFNPDLKVLLENIRLIRSQSDFITQAPKIYVEMSHYRLMIDINMYYNILNANQNDIMMHFDNKDHPEYKLVKQRLEYLNILSTAEEVKQALTKFGDLSNLMNCTVQKTFSKEPSNIKIFKEIFWIAYYFLQPKKALMETKVFSVNPDSEQVIEIWNVLSRLKPLRYFLKSSIPSVNQHLKIYVPAVFEPITLKEIVERNNTNTMFENLKSDQSNIPQPIHLNNNLSKNIGQQNQQINQLIDEQIKQAANLGESQNITNEQQQNKNMWRNYDIFDKKSQNSIKLRILSSTPLIPRSEAEKQNLNLKKEKPKLIQDIVYHIHGGGWVGINTFSHQMYTRKWTKQLEGIPIFSVEYTQAPESQYPKPLDDCWQVYQFLLNGIEEYFENIKVRKIIIVGDSAGGNMALGICLLALQRGIKRPDGLVLSYPALNLRMDFFSPSFVTIFNEIIVPYNFLKVSLDSYMDRSNHNIDPSKDPLLSPLLFSDEVLQLLPPIRMGCGDKDLLRDDCIRFLHRLVKQNHNVKMILYRELTHGYLNLDLPMTLPATYKCGYDCGLFVKQLLSGEQLPPIIQE